MKPCAIFVCGALAASIPWLLAFIWALGPPQIPPSEAERQTTINRWRGRS